MTTTIEWGKPAFLKGLRQELGMSQPELASACELTRDDIANFERGASRITAHYAVMLYRALAAQDVMDETAALAAFRAAYFVYHDQLQRELEEKERIRQESSSRIEDIKKQIKMFDKVARSA